MLVLLGPQYSDTRGQLSLPRGVLEEVRNSYLSDPGGVYIRISIEIVRLEFLFGTYIITADMLVSKSESNTKRFCTTYFYMLKKTS